MSVIAIRKRPVALRTDVPILLVSVDAVFARPGFRSVTAGAGRHVISHFTSIILCVTSDLHWDAVIRLQVPRIEVAITQHASRAVAINEQFVTFLVTRSHHDDLAGEPEGPGTVEIPGLSLGGGGKI